MTPHRDDTVMRPWLGLARRGLPEVGIAFGLSAIGSTALAFWHPLAALPGLLPAAFALWFFRDPTRRSPAIANAVLASADGLFDDVREEAACPFFPGPALRLGIYLSLLDVHVNRAPFAARARRFEYRPGARRATYRVGELEDNEQHLTWFEHAADPQLVAVVRQIAGPAARRVCNWLEPDQAVRAGERFGLIKFGSRTEVWLPQRAGLRLLATRGQRVRAGETVLAQFEDIANTGGAQTSCARPEVSP